MPVAMMSTTTSAKQMTNEQRLDLLCQIGVVPLVTLNTPDESVPLAKALVKGGVPVAEVTFRSSAALAGMRRIHEAVPDVMLIAGTVHTVEQAREAVEAGCVGIVTPAFNKHVIEWCLGSDVLVLPGTATPTDIEHVRSFGLHYAKFFPAEAYGGVRTLKALSGPFADMKFLPTGGVSLQNVQSYMELGNVFAVGGSFPVPSVSQRNQDWGHIADVCAQARAVVSSASDRDGE